MSQDSNAQNQQLWDETANYWRARFGQYGDASRIQLNDMLLRKLPEYRDGETLLDAGCGTGVLSRYIAKYRSYRVVGVDLSPQAIDIARELSTDFPTIDWYVANLESLPFDANMFDVVTMNFVLTDVPNVEKVLYEISRVMKFGGMIVATIIHPFSSLEPIAHARRSMPNNHSPTKNAFTVKDYFTPQSGLYAWTDELSTRVYHRTISYYINTFIQCGFTLTNVDEPHSDSDDSLPKSVSTGYAFPRFIVFTARNESKK